MKPFDDNYSTVVEWDSKRTVELSEKYKVYVQVTDAYADLVCEIVNVLGAKKPKSVQDLVVRDLAADVFDALHESRGIILKGKCDMAYPLARRAYESLSLMVLCALDVSFAVKWQSGVEISNGTVRRELAKHPFGETEESTKQLYKFFSSAAHPNRSMIPHRFLGEGNQFVLGAVPQPSLALVTDYCLKHLSMWFWFAAFLGYFYDDHIRAERQDFGNRYLKVAETAQWLAEQLTENFNRLLKVEQEEIAKGKES
jgi:hypothetical protein